MREIIFRGWDKINKVMRGHDRFIQIMPDILTNRSEQYEIMQFSGLRDNKRTAEFPEGQMIFEGDLINFDGGIARVEWCNDLACYLAVFADVSDVMLHAISHRCAVIGNIHEHKNLLGGEVD